MSTKAPFTHILSVEPRRIVFTDEHYTKMVITIDKTLRGDDIYVERNPKGAIRQGPSVRSLFELLISQAPYIP